MKNIEINTTRRAFTLLTCYVLIAVGCSVSSSEKSSVNVAPRDLPEYFEFSNQLSYDDYNEYLKTDPIRTERCPLPESEEFKKVSEDLGGFQLEFTVPLYPDELTPEFFYDNNGMQPSPPNVTEDSSSVTIERADLVAKQDSNILYLSKKFGMFVVSVDLDSPEQSTTSCVFSLPGTPLNFYWYEDKILVLVNGRAKPQTTNTQSILTSAMAPAEPPAEQPLPSALLILSYSSEGFEYVGNIFMENEELLDSRRFDSTLAMYTKVQRTDDNLLSYIGNQLTFVDIDSLEIIGSDFFEDYEEEIDLNDPTATRISITHNDFLSASDHYLVVSATKNIREFAGMKTYTYNMCTEYGPPYTYTICSIKWERVENPDYEPSNGGGIYDCSESLNDCLTDVGPTLSPYIWVADGVECHDYEKRDCLEWEPITYSYPTYNYFNRTSFVVYRFKNGKFHRLDNSIFELVDNEIQDKQEPVEANGLVAKHSFLKFQNDFFYVITGEALTVFTFQGNSLIKTAERELTDKTYPNAVLFSDNRIFIDSGIRYYGQLPKSVMTVFSLDQPEDPVLINTIELPGTTFEYIPANTNLLGLGLVDIKYEKVRSSLLKTSLFSEETGSELEHILWNAGDQYINSDITIDDQSFLFNSSISTLFLPFYSYGYYTRFDRQEHIAIAKVSSESFTGGNIIDIFHNVERVLDVEEQLALALSQSAVYMLYNDSPSLEAEQWEASIIKEYIVPEGAYGTTNGWWITLNQREDISELRSYTKEDIFSEEPIDVVSVERNHTYYCQAPEFHFGSNIILIAKEKDEFFSGFEDCPVGGQLEIDEMAFTGWSVDEEGRFIEMSEDELKDIYKEMQNRPQCWVNESMMDVYPDRMPGNVDCS